MTPTDTVYFIAVLGTVLGVLWRTVFPFLKKKAEMQKKGIVEKVRIEYFYSFVISLAVTIVVFLAAIVAMPSPDTAAGMMTALMQGFIYGLIFHSAGNKAVELMFAAGW